MELRIAAVKQRTVALGEIARERQRRLAQALTQVEHDSAVLVSSWEQRVPGATVPLGRMGEPQDVGDACLYLASPLSSYVSGASVLLHGGGEKPAFLGAAKNTRND